MTSGDQPEISVILTTFNRAPLIEQAIGSVVRQSFTDWELIVVDDGSDDETFAVVDRYLTHHVNIRYMKHRNRKPARSRNAGIQASFGRYITFLDSDDYFRPEHLESRHLLLETRPDIDLVSGGFTLEGDPWIRDRNDPEKFVHIDECILGGTFFGRRQLFMEIGGFRAIDYAEDTDLWERAGERYSILKIEAPESYVYRRSDNSITAQYRGKGS
ncbi:MAG: glycosyltransferase family 2 protein [Chlorobiaceae bacterium]|nr:glycosyltransferase family 2 protein [Chlorobiaceae bacterium]